MLHANSKLLADQLEKLPTLEGRYSGLKLVNDRADGKRGFFSLVFKAYDELEKRPVALKFYDLDPAKQLQYRILCFDRERELLKGLKGARRCLQLVADVSEYELIDPASKSGLTVLAKFFVTEWIDEEVDEFFLDPDHQNAVDSLVLFNEIVLAVESLHSRDIFHRDLKADNFRKRVDSEFPCVVAIDLGTAARIDSARLADYSGPVGMILYSAPESFCGLAGCREIAFFSDVYALGCLLFELFSADDFATSRLVANPDFELRLAALSTRIDPKGSDTAKLSNWSREAPRLLSGLAHIDFRSDGFRAPAAVADLLGELISSMTAANFENRTKDLATIRSRIRSAIRCLQNAALERRRAKMLEARRELQLARAKEKGKKENPNGNP